MPVTRASKVGGVTGQKDGHTEASSGADQNLIAATTLLDQLSSQSGASSGDNPIKTLATVLQCGHSSPPEHAASATNAKTGDVGAALVTKKTVTLKITSSAPDKPVQARNTSSKSPPAVAAAAAASQAAAAAAWTGSQSRTMSQPDLLRAVQMKNARSLLNGRQAAVSPKTTTQPFNGPYTSPTKSSPTMLPAVRQEALTQSAVQELLIAGLRDRGLALEPFLRANNMVDCNGMTTGSASAALPDSSYGIQCFLDKYKVWASNTDKQRKLLNGSLVAPESAAQTSMKRTTTTLTGQTRALANVCLCPLFR